MKNQKSGSSYLNYCFIWDCFCCPRGASGARSRAWQGMDAASGRSGDQSSRRRAADGRTRIESKCINGFIMIDYGMAVIGVPRSRSTRRPWGGGEDGGVMVAMGGMGIIRMLSSASAPSRVPQVV